MYGSILKAFTIIDYLYMKDLFCVSVPFTSLSLLFIHYGQIGSIIQSRKKKGFCGGKLLGDVE